MKTMSLILAATVAVTMPMMAEAKPDGEKAAKKYEKSVKKFRKEARKAAEKHQKDLRKQAKKLDISVCPPGLAKKGNGCTPPGLARQAAVIRDRDHRHEDDRDYVNRDRSVNDRADGRDDTRAIARAVASATAPLTIDMRPRPRPATLMQDYRDDAVYREASLDRDTYVATDVVATRNRDVDIDGVNDRPLIGQRLDGDYVIIEEPGLYDLDPDYTYYRDEDYVYRIDPDTREVLALIGVLENVLN